MQDLEIDIYSLTTKWQPRQGDFCTHSHFYTLSEHNPNLKLPCFVFRDPRHTRDITCHRDRLVIKIEIDKEQLTWPILIAILLQKYIPFYLKTALIHVVLLPNKSLHSLLCNNRLWVVLTQEDSLKKSFTLHI